MEELIRKAQSGDTEAYYELFQMYEQDIYKIAYSYFNNKNDALDIVQETAYRSFKSIKKMKHLDNFKSWLIKIAVNASMDLFKKHGKTVAIEINLKSSSSSESDFNNLEKEVLEKITIEYLLRELGPEEKTIILLRFYQDLSLNSISETTQLPISTVKSLLYRALKKLNKFKGGECDEQVSKRAR
ncbi:RNA polymerase sigma factor [Exiguobacterium aurantiacum]|uniref:RNA polymerase sigma factor n=1 Tax=Exiguobacterium aurantiacum TaxID=33987 RepID=UPI001E5436B7|nr:sigma-70 family RNA polymerase sigma factor [Exiguobacterium aurantiacum]